MDKLARIARLRHLVAEAGGKVDGRKKLHKLAYLCQECGTDLGQNFVFHMYGVYSPSLAQDLDAAGEWRVLSESALPGDGYEIALGTEDLSDHVPAAAASGRGFELVGRLAGRSANLLEVTSTIVYLWRRGYRDQELAAKLGELKGHLQTHFREGFALASEYFGVDAAGATAR